jgi:ketosteroid isomerase-like protein
MIEIREGSNVGFGSALITYQAISTNNTIIRTMKNRITIGFIKEEDVWKVIHQHTRLSIPT